MRAKRAVCNCLIRKPDLDALAARGRRVGITGSGLLAAWLAGATATLAAEQLPDIQPRPQPPVQVLAPGWEKLTYTLPEPGSYALPPLGQAADGMVLDTAGRKRRLHELFDGQVVLLAFIYTSCSDVNGCPLATAVMHGVFRAMQADPQLKTHLRLISLSFDPQHDTPQLLRHHERNLTGGQEPGHWQFLTTSSPAELKPLLAAYGQTVQPEYGPDGKPSGMFAHILRVFLIDPQQRIRNIYSTAFLHRDLVLNDVRTLLLESDRPARASAPRNLEGSQLSGAGGVVTGYDAGAAVTRSHSLQNRRGRPADLLGLAEHPPLGLPPAPIPSDNPLTAGKIELGRKLFFDRRLSLNDTFSCAMCHIPEQGFTSNDMATAVGIEGRSVRRNAPTLLNVAYAERLFHDGRETTLEQQVWGPLLARNEMGNPSIGALLEKVKRLSDYTGRFAAVFGRGPSMENLGSAIASYERSLLAADSPFDRWYFGGEADALSAAARRGFELFRGKAGCVSCHSIGPEYALFTDQRLHNTGIGYQRAVGDERRTRRIQVAPGTYLEVERSVIETLGEPPPGDLGLYEVTQNPADRWKYKTPTLRNVALTAPYMHDGSLATLEEVVDFYDRGGVPNENLSPLLHPLELTRSEKDDLVAFLASLTGGTVDILVADAFAATVGDLKRGDPRWSPLEAAQP